MSPGEEQERNPSDDYDPEAQATGWLGSASLVCTNEPRRVPVGQSPLGRLAQRPRSQPA